MEIVYATSSAVVALPDGSRFRVAKGSHWPAADPIVRAQPSLFSGDPRYGLTFSSEPAEYSEGSVEQTTSAPGEKRNVRRG